MPRPPSLVFVAHSWRFIRFVLSYVHLRRIRTHEYSSILPRYHCMSIAILAFLPSLIEGSFIFISPSFALFALDLSTTRLFQYSLT